MASQDYNLIENPHGHTPTGLINHSIFGEDPRLDDLAEDGWQTAAHALLPGSPAIDSGSCTDVAGGSVLVDQHGVSRPQGTDCDMGAYEVPKPSLALTKRVDDDIVEPGQRITYAIVVHNTGAADASGGVVSDTLPPGLSLAGPVTLEPSTAGSIGVPPTLVDDLAVPALGRVTVTLPVTVGASVPTPTAITNVAAVTSEEILVPETGSRMIFVASGHLPTLYLPMVVRGSP